MTRMGASLGAFGLFSRLPSAKQQWRWPGRHFPLREHRLSTRGAHCWLRCPCGSGAGPVSGPEGPARGKEGVRDRRESASGGRVPTTCPAFSAYDKWFKRPAAASFSPVHPRISLLSGRRGTGGCMNRRWRPPGWEVCSRTVHLRCLAQSSVVVSGAGCCVDGRPTRRTACRRAAPKRPLRVRGLSGARVEVPRGLITPSPHQGRPYDVSERRERKRP